MIGVGTCFQYGFRSALRYSLFLFALLGIFKCSVVVSAQYIPLAVVGASHVYDALLFTTPSTVHTDESRSVFPTLSHSFHHERDSYRTDAYLRASNEVEGIGVISLGNEGRFDCAPLSASRGNEKETARDK